MNEQLDRNLVRDFPLLFQDRRSPECQSMIAFGFGCGDGWEPLLRSIGVKVEPLIHLWIKDNPDSVEHHPRATQVKEKYGALRFYMNHATNEIYDIIESAEQTSKHICETCGKFGHLRGSYWLYTACDLHTKEQDKGRSQ